MSDNRSTHWSVTINNHTASDYEDIQRARQRGWKVEGQEERGESGTPHLQLMVKTPQVRFSAVKKAFPRAHIEVARNVVALARYVQKEQTAVCSLPIQSDKYPSLGKFWMLVYEVIESQNWIDRCYQDRWFKEAFDFFEYPREFEGVPLADLRRVKEKMALEVFENCVEHLIGEGYHVEHYYSPPNISVFKKFHFSILRRAADEIQAQTARQTDSASDPGDTSVAVEHNHVSESIQEVQVPVLPEATLDLPPSSPH